MNGNLRGGVLCLYAICGVPAEAKLTQLVGSRDRDAFEESAFDFILNLFDMNRDEVEEHKEISDFLKYIYDVQLELIHELQKKGLPLVVPRRASGMPEAIIALHKELRKGEAPSATAVDFIAKWDACLDRWSQVIPPDPEIGDARDFAQCTLQEMASTYNLYCFFTDVHNAIGFVPHVERDVIISEVMAYLGHVSRAYVFALGKDDNSCIKDFAAGFLHMRRAILDMRKGMMNTVFAYELQNGTNFIDTSFVLSLLGLRHEEVILGPYSPQKCKLYSEQTKYLVRTWVEHLRNKGINLPAYLFD